MIRTFPNIRIGLMVGIGGGAPSPKHDIRLGDFIVSIPVGATPSVVQYDFGKAVQNKSFVVTNILDKLPQALLAATAMLDNNYLLKGHELSERISEILEKRPRLRTKFSRPPPTSDRLYKSDFTHDVDGADCLEGFGDQPLVLVSRQQRQGDEKDNIRVHQGLIASANTLMKDAHIRDALTKQKDVLCFEMEAAGLMDHFPCLFIRVICDYADSHKNDEWQGYAAMAAASYAKDLLYQILPEKIEKEMRIDKVLEDST